MKLLSLTNSAAESVRSCLILCPYAAIRCTNSMMWSCVSFLCVISLTSMNFEYSSTMSEKPVFPLTVGVNPVTASQWMRCIVFDALFSLSNGIGWALAFAMLQEVHRLMTSSISEWRKRGIFPFSVSFFINVAPGCPSALCHIRMFSDVIFILIIFGVPSIFGKCACLLTSSPFREMGGKIGIRKRFSLTSFVMTMWVLLGPRIVQVFSLKSTRKPFWHILETDSNILHRSGMYNTSSMMRSFAPLL